MADPHGGRVNFAAAALGKCPVCTQDKLYKSYLKVADLCAVCGQNFKAADTGDGPVVFVILIAGFLTCAGLFTTFLMYPDWSVMTHLMIWPATAIVISLVLMPVLKSLMIASQLRNKVRD